MGEVKRSRQAELGAAGPRVPLTPLRGPLSARRGRLGTISLTHLGSVGSKGLLRPKLMTAEGSHTAPRSRRAGAGPTQRQGEGRPAERGWARASPQASP